MESLSDIISMIGGIVTSIALPLLGVFIFYDSKKRSEAAKAKQAEAAARKSEEEYLSIRAGEWRKLYDEVSEDNKKLNDKIDSLYVTIEDDRKRIRELQEKNMQLSLELQKANFMKCEVKGCEKRQPPTGY